MQVTSFRLVQILGIAWLLATASLASAHDYKVGPILIDHVYARPTPPGAKVGGGYIGRLTNTSNKPDQLIAASSPVATSVELHQMMMQGDIMRMNAVPAIEIPANGKVSLSQGGMSTYHLMLMGLKAPLKDGDKFAITLVFKQAGKKQVTATVQSPKTLMQDPEHAAHTKH